MNYQSNVAERPFCQPMRPSGSTGESAQDNQLHFGHNGSRAFAMGDGTEREEMRGGSLAQTEYPPVSTGGQGAHLQPVQTTQPQFDELLTQFRAREHPFFARQAELFQEMYDLWKELGRHKDEGWVKHHLSCLKTTEKVTPNQLAALNEKEATSSEARFSRDESAPVIKRELEVYKDRTRWMLVRAEVARESSANTRQGAEPLFNFEARGFTVEALREYIQEIEKHWNDKSHPDSCSVIDDILMQDLVDYENFLNPEINMHYIADAYFFGSFLKKIFLNDQMGSGKKDVARFLVRTGDIVQYKFKQGEIPQYVISNEFHFCAVEVRRVQGVLSVIVMEPGPDDGAARAAATKAKILKSLRENDISCKLLYEYLNVQKSADECGIFSLSFLRKCHSQDKVFDLLHEKNKNGAFDALKLESRSNIFPPELMKHASSTQRVEEYIKWNPLQENIPVNKKNETLTARVARERRGHFVMGKMLHYNTSIEEKRLRILKDFGAEVERRIALKFQSENLELNHAKEVEKAEDQAKKLASAIEKEDLPAALGLMRSGVGLDSKLTFDFAKNHDCYDIQAEILRTRHPNIYDGFSTLGHTPVMAAMHLDLKMDVLELLMKVEGFDIDEKDTSGATAFLHALRSKKINIATRLKGEGADTDIVDRNGKSAYDAIKSFDNTDYENYFRLLNDVNKPMACGKSPLIYEAWHGNVPRMELLLKQGANIDLTLSSYKFTPLMVAAQQGKSTAVKFLLSKKASLNERTKQGGNALTYAILANDLSSVKILLDAGIETSAPDFGKKESALSTAKNRGFKEIIECIEAHEARK